MKRPTNERFAIVIVILMICTIAFLNVGSIYKLYIRVFKKSTIIQHHNSKGQLDGEYIAYVNGKIYGQAYYVNGLKEGLCSLYFDSGLLQNETFYKHDKANGVENEYYENGFLNYTVKWRNGQRYGSEYHYLPNKKLFNYDTFGVGSGKEDSFYYSEFDSSGHSNKVFGDVFSSNLYYVNKVDSTIILTDNQTYHDITDLYITVATPPGLTPIINISINDKPINNFRIINNTIKIWDAFHYKNNYKIAIHGKFITPKKQFYKNDSLFLTIKKD